MYLRNMVLLWLVAGSLHLTLYTLKLHGNVRKYHPQWQAKHAKKFLFNDQVYDNAFRSCVSGCTIWTAYEVLYVWGAANHWWPYISPSQHPVWFVALFLLIPLWRETHFYFIHRAIHWRPLMMAIHRVHHMNPNPGPWTGLAMHPLEHLLYFSVVAIHFIVPSHPLHFFFNAQLTALTPAMGHHGFEGPLFNGTLVRARTSTTCTTASSRATSGSRRFPGTSGWGVSTTGKGRTGRSRLRQSKRARGLFGRRGRPQSARGSVCSTRESSMVSPSKMKYPRKPCPSSMRGSHRMSSAHIRS